MPYTLEEILKEFPSQNLQEEYCFLCRWSALWEGKSILFPYPNQEFLCPKCKQIWKS